MQQPYASLDEQAAQVPVEDTLRSVLRKTNVGLVCNELVARGLRQRIGDSCEFQLDGDDPSAERIPPANPPVVTCTRTDDEPTVEQKAQLVSQGFRAVIKPHELGESLLSDRLAFRDAMEEANSFLRPDSLALTKRESVLDALLIELHSEQVAVTPRRFKLVANGESSLGHPGGSDRSHLAFEAEHHV